MEYYVGLDVSLGQDIIFAQDVLTSQHRVIVELSGDKIADLPHSGLAL